MANAFGVSGLGGLPKRNYGGGVTPSLEALPSLKEALLRKRKAYSQIPTLTKTPMADTGVVKPY